MRSAQAFLFAALLLTSCDSDDDEPAQPSGGGNTSTCTGTTVTDIDGNVYPVVQIGSQCWMAENLRTSRYRDGSVIPNVTGAIAWTQMNSGACCSFENSSSYDAAFGKLYNWYAASNPNLCPQGWHVPTDAEWQQLELSLGMPLDQVQGDGPYQTRGAAENVGGKMKSTGNVDAGSGPWWPPNLGATNSSGFSVVPSGGRDSGDGSWSPNGGASIGESSLLWSTSSLGTDAWHRLWDADGAGVGRDYFSKKVGICVRCLQD